ncbi:lysozyme inhibitor LprI family protein [Oceanisphaera sp. KMM 10153]|uniref:lysozyme inhibitor LprI family protein n=1 Tax=Oceanisphaera submarina TaxID=3390193 RepID=UPI0039752CAB
MKRYVLLVLTCLSFSVMATEEIVDCNDPKNTIEINECAISELGSAKAELRKYLEAGFERHAGDATLIASIKVAQEDWRAYMASHCNSVYTQWRDGTIRGLMAISCKTKLTKQRSHEIWDNFLTYMDSTPPVLPEPKE